MQCVNFCSTITLPFSPLLLLHPQCHITPLLRYTKITTIPSSDHPRPTTHTLQTYNHTTPWWSSGSTGQQRPCLSCLSFLCLQRLRRELSNRSKLLPSPPFSLFSASFCPPPPERIWHCMLLLFKFVAFVVFRVLLYFYLFILSCCSCVGFCCCCKVLHVVEFHVA